MVSVSELAARNIAEKHDDAAVSQHGFTIRPREDMERDSAARESSVHQLALSASHAAGGMYPSFGTRADMAARPVGGWAKRAFDVTIALTGLILMAPIMGVIAALIYITMGGPVLFAQQRVGFKQRSFRCYKFRTMVADADERLARHLQDDPDAAHAWRETQKLQSDPRVTPLGHILRKSSLDELPQLFNILRGDMSCIGPRPVPMKELLQRYGSAASDYIRAKPGLTGMWQVNGRSATNYTHRIKCDRYYVRRWSLLLDIKILFRTVPAVLKFDETS